MSPHKSQDFIAPIAEIQRAPLEQIVLQIKTLEVFRGRDVEVYIYLLFTVFKYYNEWSVLCPIRIHLHELQLLL